MSCNGCRVLRRGCSEACILRPCLEWIDNPKAQGNATLFLSKFFGRSDLMAFISAVPPNKRPALFQSLLYEACGRAVNPVNGAVGLLSTGNWHLCEAAVETVLSGGVLRPIAAGVLDDGGGSSGWKSNAQAISEAHPYDADGGFRIAPPTKKRQCGAASFESSGTSDMAGDFEGSNNYRGVKRVVGVEPKLLNLFG